MSKIVLITGASRGIGWAIAEQFSTPDYIVVGAGSNEESAAKITEQLAARSQQGMGIVLNLTDSKSITEALATIKATYNASPLILVNNAGVTQDNLLLRMKDAEWDTVMNTNLTGTMHLTKACLRGMLKAEWGRIVSLGSVVGAMGNAGQCNYAAAKAGLIGFSKSLAREIASRNITVNVVAPGFVRTDMTASLPEDIVESLLKQTPISRFAEPSEIAAAVGFLASDQAGYITGETLNINGGMYMV
ncbi:MAG: 3-oxoacyl-[acyl-carrier-protein] reductase [Gammaproteobacteria bacterium]